MSLRKRIDEFLRAAYDAAGGSCDVVLQMNETTLQTLLDECGLIRKPTLTKEPVGYIHPITGATLKIEIDCGLCDDVVCPRVITLSYLRSSTAEAGT